MWHLHQCISQWSWDGRNKMRPHVSYGLHKAVAENVNILSTLSKDRSQNGFQNGFYTDSGKIEETIWLRNQKSIGWNKFKGPIERSRRYDQTISFQRGCWIATNKTVGRSFEKSRNGKRFFKRGNFQIKITSQWQSKEIKYLLGFAQKLQKKWNKTDFSIVLIFKLFI